MTTSGNSNATLLLVTGLISVGMAALGYYYLHMNSKKHRALINDSSKAGAHSSQKTSTPTTVTEKEKIVSVKPTVANVQTSGGGTSSTTGVSRTTSRKIAASVSKTIEKNVAIEMLMLPPVSPKKALETSKTIVEKVVESPVKVVDSSVVAETVKEVTLSPEKTPNSSPKKTAGNLKKEIESPMLVLYKPFNTSPKKAPGTPKKVDESPKQIIESPKKVVEQTKTVTIESPKKAPGTTEKDVENPKETYGSPKKDVEQTEAATIESPKKVVEQTEAATIEHPKQAPASPSKKKTAGPKKATEPAPATEELKSVTSKVSEDFIAAQAVAEKASAFADKTLQDMLENIALDQEYVQVDLTQSMTLSQSTPELINIEDALVKTEEIVPTSAATEDEESIVEEEQEQEQKEEEEHAQIASEPTKPVSAEPVVDTAATTETLASSKTPDTTPVSWEAIVLSPEMEAASAQEPTTPLSLDAPLESTESTEPLSINVPAENTEEPVEDKSAISPVDSGGSTPGKRNRNRSKKSKSKKKKGKKH